MRIILGHGLDGAHLPANNCGTDRLVCGPGLLLDQLEMRLGVPTASNNEFTQLSRYISAIHQSCDKTETFYSASFQIDSFATGKQLYQLRNQLHLYGWNGTSTESAPEKIKQLAKVEYLFTNSSLNHSEPSRLRTLITCLSESLSPKIDSVELVDPIASFPPLWQELLALLPTEQINTSSPPNSEANNLELLKQNLKTTTTASPSANNSPNDDHSVRIFESQLELTNCKAVAQLINNYITTQESVTIIASQQSRRALDDYLAQVNLPRIGHRVNLSAGSYMQIVVLYLRLHWAPTAPQHWLEFLLHPVSPLPLSLSRRLAKALDRTPSCNSPLWQEAIENYTETAENKSTAQKLIKTWLSPAAFDETNAHISSFIASIDLIADWLKKRGKNDGEQATAARAVHTSLIDLRTALSNSVTIISRIEWDRFVAEWLNYSSINQNTEAELSLIQVVNSPAQIIAPSDHVIWWQPEQTSFPDTNWTKEELAWLNANHISSNWREQKFKTSERQSHRPVFHANRSVTFIVTHHSSQQEVPPLLDRANAILGDKIVLDPESVLDSVTINRHSLPSPLSSIQTSRPDLLNSERAESFSSLYKYLYHPLSWVLDYQANLQEGSSKKYRIINDAKRRGSLLHGFVESLLEPESQQNATPKQATDIDATDLTSPSFGVLETLVTRLFGAEKAGTKWTDIQEKELRQWVESQWNDLLANQAAHLLVSGNESSRYELFTLACDGLWALIKHLDSANVVHAVCEREIQPQPFVGGEIRGYIDLQVIKESGETALIDLKLGGKSNKRDELKKGRHLQLATYGHLVEQNDAIEASTAYFIFMGGGILLARSKDFFPNAEVWINPKDTQLDDWGSCWQKFEQLWQRRHQQIEQGLIEIPNATTNPTIDMGSWTIKEADKYSPYKNLTGWEESA